MAEKEYIERETSRAKLILNDELHAADLIKSIPAADVRTERYAQKVKFFNDPWTGRMFTTCTACDGKVGQHDKFCKHCGAKFEVGE